MKKKISPEAAARKNRVGGQAVLEGVMMKSGEQIAVAVRREDGGVAVECEQRVSVRKKHKILNLPILRGVVNFVESMVIGYGTLTKSVEMMGIEEEETKFEKWVKKKFGKSVLDFLMVLAVILGVGIGLVLFAWLPQFVGVKILGAATGITDAKELKASSYKWWLGAISGVMKIMIFISYILLVSLMKDIRRTFEYHGAEHKSIACFEAGLELTPENAKKCTRFHPRCGTSFIFVMLIIGIIVGTLLTFVTTVPIYRTLFSIACLPIIAGVGFEFLMYAGKHENIVTKIFSAPGLLMQRITTREPDLDQLAIAITSLKMAMKDEFPDFDPQTYSKAKAPDENAEQTDGEPVETEEKAEEQPAEGEEMPEELRIIIEEKEGPAEGENA